MTKRKKTDIKKLYGGNLLSRHYIIRCTNTFERPACYENEPKKNNP